MPNKTGLCLGAYNEKRSEHVLTWRGLDFSRSTRVRPRFRRGDRRHDQPSRKLVAVVPSDDATSMTRGDSGGQLTLGCPGSVARSDRSGWGGGRACWHAIFLKAVQIGPLGRCVFEHFGEQHDQDLNSCVTDIIGQFSA